MKERELQSVVERSSTHQGPGRPKDIHYMILGLEWIVRALVWNQRAKHGHRKEVEHLPLNPTPDPQPEATFPRKIVEISHLL